MNVVIDMNLSPTWVELLVEAGFNAVHWSSLGVAYAPDREIMAYARARNWIVLTNDLDFSKILASTRNTGPSVVQLRAADLRLEAIGPSVIAALTQLRSGEDASVLITITAKRTRLRLLPFPERL